MSIRTNEELDPNEGPGFGCFIWQAALFAGILLLIPVGLFTFSWPVWVLASLMFVDMVLLFFVSMTSVFLLRVFFAERRRGRGRTIGAARTPARVISSQPDDQRGEAASEQDDSTDEGGA
jgi:membrane protein implicated in regulation of membrane protease activity